MQVWVNGEQYTFRGDEITTVLALGRVADSTEQAWEFVAEYGRIRNRHSDEYAEK